MSKVTTHTREQALAERGTQLALSLAGFNLGIEGMQLLLVLLALPSLIALSRLPGHATLRNTCAALTAGAALGWLLDRLGVPNPVARAADSAGSHTSQLFLVLITAAALSALLMLALHRRGRGVTGAGHESGPPRTPVLTARGVNKASQQGG